MIVIRKTTDSEAALEIAKKLHGSYFNDHGIEEIAKETKERKFYGAFVEEKMVGFITYKEINPEVVELTWMAVDPSYQDQGIGAKLLAQSLKMIEGSYKACMVKTLSSEDPNEGYQRTRNFYEKMGFIPLETIKPYPGWDPKIPCQFFVKPLNN